MSLVMTSGPAVEPITLAEAKALARIDGDAEDALIQSLIITSRLHIEAALGLALVTQSWRLSLDVWPAGDTLDLPLRPVAAVTAVRVLAADGQATVLAPERYRLDADSAVPRLVRAAGSWPAPGRARNGIEIELTAGYGDTAADIPQPIRHALLLLLVHWYEHRDPIEIGQPSTRIPPAVSALLEPYRIKRL